MKNFTLKILGIFVDCNSRTQEAIFLYYPTHKIFLVSDCLSDCQREFQVDSICDVFLRFIFSSCF